MSTVPSTATPSPRTDDKMFNPVVAMQSVIAGDLVPIKQRSKAAQQLATYFCELPTTPSLYAYYEPYMPIIASVVVTPIKAAKEVQENAIKMLKALGSHSPRQYVEWCALHVSMDPTQEPWYVDWCCGLLLAAETRVPRRSAPYGNNVADHADTIVVWDDRSIELQELEAATAAVFHVWRSVVDNADDEDIVYEIAIGMRTLLCYQPAACEQAWRALVTSKIQPHFVDMTDVFIGWAMSTSTSKRLRDAIFALLEEMRELWIGNNVFCLQLLESFVNDIGSIYASPTSTSEDFGRLDSIILCSTLVAQFIPVAALATRNGLLGFVETLLRASDRACSFYSCETVLRLSESFSLLATAQSERFALLNMRAIRFLLAQVAHQIVTRRCDMDSALHVLEKASGLAKMLSAHHSDVDSRLQAKNFLADVIVGGRDGKAEFAVLEVLLSLKYFAAVKYSTEIVIETALYIGVEGLQLIVAELEKKMVALGDANMSFWVTCFILVCKHPQWSNPPEDASAATKTVKALLSIIHQVSITTQTGHAAAVMRLVSVFVAVVKKWDRLEMISAVSELILAQVRVSISLMRSRASEPTFMRDLFGSLAWGISSYPPSAELPPAEQTAIVKQLQLFRMQDTAALRTEFVNLLVALAPLLSDTTVSAQVFMVASELMEECDDSERVTLSTKVLACLQSTLPLIATEQQFPKTRSAAFPRRSIWESSEMQVGDFEQVYELLSRPDATGDEWYRTCRRIHSRMRRDQNTVAHDRPTLIKAIVGEAAKWVVQNRLRSPLGPPSAIFSGVEKMVQTHANHHTAHRHVLNASFQEAISAMMLGEFVVAMEAMLGAATDLKCPDSNPDSDVQKIQAFFRANVAVCEEWLSRIRPGLVELSVCLKQSEAFLHHSHATTRTLARKLETQLLRHPAAMQSDETHVRVMKSTIELEGSVFVYAKSLCELGDSDSVLGLRVWWGEVLSRLINIQGPSAAEWEKRLMLSSASSSWLQALALQAELKYEDAAKCYDAILARTMQCGLPPQASPELLLHPLLSPIGLSLTTFVGCARECGRCLAALRCWDKLAELSARCQAFALSLSGKWGRIAPFAGLMELCEAWAIEAPIISTLRQLEDLSDGSFQSPGTAQMRVDIAGARASAVLDKWGALGIADHSNAAISQRDNPASLEDVNRVAEGFQALRFRPDNSFSDTLSPTTLRVRESTLLVASVLADRDVNVCGQLPRRLQVVTSRGMEHLFDPTQWARLYPESSEEYLQCVPPEWWLALARAARKQKNYAFATSVLTKLPDSVVDKSDTSSLAVLYEKAVLKMTSESCHEGVLALVKLCESVLQAKSSLHGITLADTVHVRALLRLARTLEGVVTGDEFGSIEAAMSIMGSRVERNASKGLVEYRDNLVMVCLKSATQVSPTNPQTWYEFSKWCHQQGRQSLDDVVNDGGLLELLPAEEAELQLLLEALKTDEAVTESADIRDIFRRVMDGGSLLSNREERLRRALSGVVSATSQQDFVDQFISLQSRVVSRLLHPIKNAATGYKSFLLTASLQESNVSSGRDSSRITSVALRLLRMLTRFGSESDVVSTVTDVFTSGPLAPWGRIVPQLLSRIGHSYSDVSNPVAALLVRLARRYPHLVVYPAVVEAGRRQDVQDGNTTGKKLISDVLSELRSYAPDLAEGVGRMVDELKRISILWDDAWIWALVKMSGDVNRRISTLEKEAHRVDKNSSLSADEKNQLARRKAVAIMTPVLVAVERLWADTLGQALPGSTLTPHEKLFVQKYGSTISKAIQAFRGCCGVPSLPTDTQGQLETSPQSGGSLSPSEVWQPFSDLLKVLGSAVGRRERIDLAEISPILARTSHKSKAALMPGTFSSESLNLSAAEMITVREVSRSVAILRTKTKPKCLKFVGSDGQGHRYLLKAREDLHLDERIMQFLETVNQFLRADRASNSRNLRARNYSVVPLSSDAGLIQIVPDVLPLFQIYTSRVDDSGDGVTTPGPAAAAAAAADLDEATLPLQQPPTAPFYAKLKQHGIQDVAPSQRSRWPLPILRRVHEDLVSARPTNVIERELAAQSADYADVWAKKYRFGRSTAVMSVLGYLVGLGDRHLDNMLLCAATGELLHIDYNVCFDKGRKLKVPEVVPFRLTPVMVDALGIAGVEGVYRSAFVNTLRVVRDPDSREALLALLDAFVYDPLADWVADGKNQAFSRDTKQRMDVNVNLSLFLSRARERSQETASFVAKFKSSSSSVESILEQTVGWVGRDIISYCQRLTQAIEVKKRADGIVRQKERDWSELTATHPQEEASMNSVLGLLEGDKTRIALFAKQCHERHQHITQMQGRLSNYIPRSATDFGSRSLVGGDLARAHARIVSIVTQLPVSSSTSVWMSMLSSLEGRCLILDQQIPTVVEKCERVVTIVGPLVQEYMARRGGELARRRESSQGDDINTSDVYGVWCDWCTKLLGALSDSDYTRVLELARSIANAMEQSPANDCSRQRHSTLITELKREVSQTGGSVCDERSGSAMSENIGNLVQAFSNSLSALKLSNSQTHRVVKLISIRWILSSTNRLDEPVEDSGMVHTHPASSLRGIPFVRDLHDVAYAASILRQLALTSKGSVMKIIAELLTSESHVHGPENDSVLTALEFTLAVIATLQSIFTDCMEEMVRRQYCARHRSLHANDGTLDNGVDDSATNGQSGTSMAVQLGSTLAAQLHTLAAACSQLGQPKDIDIPVEVSAFQAIVCEVMKRDVVQPDGQDLVTVADQLSAAATTFLSRAVLPVLKVLLRHIVCNEWNFSADIFDRDQSFVDSLAVEAMPALTASLDSPLAGFHMCCDSFDRLWPVWSNQSTEASVLNTKQRRLDTLTTLLDEHKRHIAFLDWDEGHASEAVQGQLSRSELLHKVSIVAPTLPQLYEEIGLVESNFLEVAQQLEYVASQISFSGTMGISANEAVLQEICRDLQDLYSKTSHHFQGTREISEVALGINTVETSLRRICSAATPSTLEVEVNQVGGNLVQSIVLRVDQLIDIKTHAAGSAMSALKVQLKEARQSAKQAEADVMTRHEALAAACRSLDATGVSARVTELTQQVHMVAELMQSIGLPNGPGGVNETQPKYAGASHKRADQTKFALAENERLVKILQRSVESVLSMQEINDVLADHVRQFQQLQLQTSSIAKALANFCASAIAALKTQDIPHCILAINELMLAFETFGHQQGAHGVMSGVSSLLEDCCQKFFEAARLADELTKSEELAPSFDGVNGQPGNDLAESSEDNGEDAVLDLLDEDLTDPLDVPLRPIAGFQEQNRYGVDVVTRIDEKLGGIVVESGSRDPLSVEDQTSWLIRAATNVDNLCVMYEGWTPWI